MRQENLEPYKRKYFQQTDSIKLLNFETTIHTSVQDETKEGEVLSDKTDSESQAFAITKWIARIILNWKFPVFQKTYMEGSFLHIAIS